MGVSELGVGTGRIVAPLGFIVRESGEEVSVYGKETLQNVI